MSTAVTSPQDVVQVLCERLTAQRDTLDAQVRALRTAAMRTDGALSAELLLTLYLSMPSAKHAAQFVNERGWRVPSATGLRALTPQDVYAVVRGEPCAIAPSADAVLSSMALERLSGRGGWMPR